ncbi:MAG: hypothetical protein QOG69_686, partial [Actinomycetota bacterium]|nr:hypothetical protein [Actinomycetota bacterium]
MRTRLVPLGRREEVAYGLDDELVVLDLPEAGHRNGSDDAGAFDV